ncbi:NmrA family NAD(P)-binding protein [Paracoccus aminophilus]|nr:NAD(P)H-binding protein [Paracoccus aminophilus]
MSHSDHAAATGPILVTGATGKLGRIVTRELIARGIRPRVLSRNPDSARRIFGASVDIVAGDFRDLDSLARAVSGIARLFLLSPISETLAEDQIAVIEAARAAGVTRIVKISGSDWTVGTSFSGDAHQAIETHLASAVPQSVAIRPNAWAQVSLAGTIRQIRAGGPIHARHGAAEVAYIDIRDIADVAVSQLLAEAPAPGPLVITGGEALSTDELARIASGLAGREITVSAEAPAVDPGAPSLPAFEQGVIAQFIKVISAGGAAGVTQTVSEILGRAPRRVEDYLSEALVEA